LTGQIQSAGGTGLGKEVLASLSVHWGPIWGSWVVRISPERALLDGADGGRGKPGGDAYKWSSTVNSGS
jgi:hypothetical protein